MTKQSSDSGAPARQQKPGASDTTKTANTSRSRTQAEQVAHDATVLSEDLAMADYVAASAATEEAGELFDDALHFGAIVQKHAQRQAELGREFFNSMTQVRSPEQWFAVHLHLARTTADNQLAFMVDCSRLTTAALLRTREMFGARLSTLESAIASGGNRTEAERHPTKH